MKEIKLTKGMVALVDDEDYKWLNQWKWYYSSAGYARRDPYERNKRSHIMMHRLINHTPKGMETDHINGNRIDNRKKNLRSYTRQQNRVNKPKLKTNTSGINGVSWHKKANKWRAQVYLNDKQIYLGLFTNILEAKKVHDEKARELFGEFVYDEGLL